MSLTLYRKYRPKIFQEVEGQDHVVKTLKGALLAGRVGHAYLFAGPRGTGKTTVARLLAKALNCANLSGISEGNLGNKLSARRNFSVGGLIEVEPCNTCSSCTEINDGRSLDLIEIDAASNRGIDEIRNIRDSARVAATASNYKIFVIDEAHMLTPPAFSALLKTLEEPPPHVVFILATTEPHKFLETILSRVQRFDFRKITGDQIVKKLERVARLEEVIVEPAALEAIALHASGSLRDAESALAKLVAYVGGGEIAVDHAREILGIIPLEAHESFLKAIVEKKSQVALAQIAGLAEAGVDLENFTKQFLGFTRARLIGLAGGGSEAILTASWSADGTLSAALLVNVINVFMRARAALKTSPIPQLPLELAVLELTNAAPS